MLSIEEHELLYRVGSETPLGNLMRHYWVPVLESSELEPGLRAKRVRILGEDLVAFRTPSGDLGLVGEFCSHRWTSLYFGRLEETGIRCVYHGWKYGLDGQCLDMPNEPAASDFKGHEIRGGYAPVKNMLLLARLYIVDAITTIQDGSRFRFDFNYKF